MSHVVLLGDSIFDNGAYVGGEPDVVAQLGSILPPGWKASLRTVDGGLKIAQAIARLVQAHDFVGSPTGIYV